jgi:hypothetical protein
MTQAGYGLRFAVAALATWRVSHLVASEDGPGDVVVRARRRVGESWVGSLMDCFGCVSVWVAAPFGLFAANGRRALLPTWLAVSGAAFLLEEVKNDGLLRREASGAPALE